MNAWGGLFGILSLLVSVMIITFIMVNMLDPFYATPKEDKRATSTDVTNIRKILDSAQNAKRKLEGSSSGAP